MNRVISYKYPDTLSTLYKKDYRSNKPFLETCPHGKKLQFILEKEKRRKSIKFGHIWPFMMKTIWFGKKKHSNTNPHRRGIDKSETLWASLWEKNHANLKVTLDCNIESLIFTVWAIGFKIFVILIWFKIDNKVIFFD